MIRLTRVSRKLAVGLSLLAVFGLATPANAALTLTTKITQIYEAPEGGWYVNSRTIVPMGQALAQSEIDRGAKITIFVYGQDPSFNDLIQYRTFSGNELGAHIDGIRLYAHMPVFCTLINEDWGEDEVFIEAVYSGVGNNTAFGTSTVMSGDYGC